MRGPFEIGKASMQDREVRDLVRNIYDADGRLLAEDVNLDVAQLFAASWSLLEQVRRDRDFFQSYAANAKDAMAYFTYREFLEHAAAADATLRAVLGEEGK